MKITTVGMDLAKNVMQVHGIDERGKAVLRKRLRREQVSRFFANLPPCLIGMEACASAHHWGRTLQRFGHTVRLCCDGTRLLRWRRRASWTSSPIRSPVAAVATDRDGHLDAIPQFVGAIVATIERHDLLRLRGGSRCPGPAARQHCIALREAGLIGRGWIAVATILSLWLVGCARAAVDLPQGGSGSNQCNSGPDESCCLHGDSLEVLGRGS